jgi:hypothetical protein
MTKYNQNSQYPTFQQWCLEDLFSLIIIIFFKLSPNENKSISFYMYFKIFTHISF